MRFILTDRRKIDAFDKSTISTICETPAEVYGLLRLDDFSSYIILVAPEKGPAQVFTPSSADKEPFLRELQSMAIRVDACMDHHAKAELITLDRLIEAQKKWLDDHGRDLTGYIKNYGSKDDRVHCGDGGEAIYRADLNELHRLERKKEFAEIVHDRPWHSLKRRSDG